ncbi:hypothetical protein CGCSCA5_v009657 [Colletotrichum siamense]|nr:hypothetical protein CGCSCA5_v009657 [Colletotrichum siamense]KAF4867960.1 hypothetical protein CGCSCA1_v012882 [Colletotrichum siamense]
MTDVNTQQTDKVVCSQAIEVVPMSQIEDDEQFVEDWLRLDEGILNEPSDPVSQTPEHEELDEDWFMHQQEIFKEQTDPVNYYASHPDLRRLPGLRFPGEIGDPVTRVGQAGWRMFFDGPALPSHSNKLLLAAKIKKFTDVCVEVVTESRGVGQWNDILREAMQRLTTRTGREKWGAVAVEDCSKCMTRLVGARNLFLRRSDLRRGHLRGQRPIKLPKGFRPFLASLDRWIEASVWIQPGHEPSATHESMEPAATNEIPQRPPKRSHDETSPSDEDVEPPNKIRQVKAEDTGASDQVESFASGYEQRIAMLEAENRKLQHSLAKNSKIAEEDDSRRPRNWVKSARDWAASFWG